MKLTRVGVDLAKNVFQVHGVDRAERPAWCRRLRRNRWVEEMQQNVEPGAEIGMEACGGAHHWARVLQSKKQWGAGARIAHRGPTSVDRGQHEAGYT
jgi:transposase